MTTIVRNAFATVLAIFAAWIAIVIVGAGDHGTFVKVLVVVIACGALLAIAVEGRVLGPRPRDQQSADDTSIAAMTPFVVAPAWLAVAFVLPLNIAGPVLIYGTIISAIGAVVLQLARMFGRIPSKDNVNCESPRRSVVLTRLERVYVGEILGAGSRTLIPNKGVPAKK